MNKEQLQQEYQAGRRDFTHLNLSGLDLTYINLAGANLTGSNLNGSILISARLADANFTEVSLENSNIESASLGNANLTGANLTKTNLHGVYLQGANLTGANLTKTNLKSASLGNANLTGANLTKTNLHGVYLQGANLTSAKLKKANLKNTSLKQAILRNANLIGADLTKANLEESDLTGANLIDSKVDGVYWLGCKLNDLGVLPDQEALVWQIHNIGVQNLDLSGKNLSNANLYKANLAGADLTGTDVSGTRLECANLTAANLTRANLSGTSLKRANLTAANLTNANLTNVRLKYVNFRRANLQGIQFEGTSFFSADLIDAINLPSPILSPLFVPDNHPDADLVYSLRSLTEGLTCTSEADYPYDIFLWDAAIREEFTLEKFLKEIGHIRFKNLQILQFFDSDTDQITIYDILLDKIQEHLSDIEIYKFETSHLIKYSSKSSKPNIIIGRTAVGDWFGVMIINYFEISTGIGTEFGMNTVTQMSEALGKDDKAIEKAEHINLISAVKEAGTESKDLFWSLAEDRDTMLHKLLLAADVFVVRGVEDHSYVTQEDLYEESQMDEETKIEQEKKKEFY